MTTRKENEMDKVENEPTGYEMVLWIQHLLWPAVVSLPVYGDVLSRWFVDILHWCQDALRYWDVTFITRKAGISVEVFGWDDFSVLSDAYTDSAQLPAALCQAIYRAVQVREKAK